MRIKITKDIPVGAEHGMKIGREFDVIRQDEHTGRGTGLIYVMGDAGKEVGIYPRECEIVSG